jgi:hypothetical protein
VRTKWLFTTVDANSNPPAFLGLPVATLHQWRYLGIGPRAYKVGRWLKYDPADIVAWLQSQAA